MKTSERTWAEAHGEDLLRPNLQKLEEGLEAWKNNLNEMARYDNGKEEMQNELIPIVLERGTEFA